MAMSLERDAQMESLLEGRKKQLGISMVFDSGMRLGRQIALSHGFGRGQGIGEALQAADDNQPPKRRTDVQEDRSGEDDDQ